jgi:hypothetical protein
VRAEVDPRLRTALDGSVGWYEDITALHGVASRLEDGLWMSVGPPPPLHSDVVVVEPTVTVDQVERALDGRAHWGFKDSFATIQPGGSDVQLLFSATWIHRRPRDERGTAPRAWSRVTDARALADWTAHHDTANVLVPGLLERGHVRVLARYVDGAITAGAVARLGSGAVDVSNVFAVTGNSVDWAELAADIEATHPGRAMVGFEHGEDLASALAGGFEAVGELRVWVG